MPQTPTLARAMDKPQSEKGYGSHPLSRTCDLFSSHCPCPCAEAITVPALRAQCLPVPHRNCSYLPATLFPRALAEGQAMPPRMAVLSTSVCLTVGPLGQRHGRCRRGRTPTRSPRGEHAPSCGSPARRREDSRSSTALPAPNEGHSVGEGALQSRETLQGPEGFLSTSWAAGWPVPVPDCGQGLLPCHKGGPIDD